MSRHRIGRYSLSQEFFPETRLVIIPEENASSNNQLDISKISIFNEDKQETNENEPQKRKTVSELIKANELRIKHINNEKQELERRLTTRAKNRELWKQKLEQFRAKLKQNKESGNEVNAFYKVNKIGLEDIGIYSSKELDDYLRDEDEDWSSLEFQPNTDININILPNKKYKNEQSPIDFGQETISPITPVYKTKVPPLKITPKTQSPQIQNQSSTKAQSINYHQNIISSINALSVPQYTLSLNLINDPSFLDVICINCYEIVKYDQMDNHSEKCVIVSSIENMTIEKENTFDDCNSRMYKLYSSLKERNEEYLNSINPNLIHFYEALVEIVYQILINNNSIEEINECSLELNDLMNTSLVKITGKERAIFDIFCRRMVQLIYIKTIEMKKIFTMPNDSKENKETNQTSFEDNIIIQKDSVISIANANQRVSSHARIISSNAISEIYSDIDDKRKEDYYDDDSASASEISSQSSFFQNNVSCLLLISI